MKISLCIICKNEEENITRCIKSVRSIVDEVIVVDTGSEDGTMEVARQEGATIYETVWEEDFAKVRNYALSKVTGDWIIFLDADEYVDETTVENIKPCIEQCIEFDKNVILSTLINLNEERIIDTSTTLRIFANNEYLRYVGKVHERLVSESTESVRRLDCREYINILHTGYSQKEVERKDKFTRNEQMLLRELGKEKREHLEYGLADVHYYLTEVYEAKKNHEKVTYHAQEALKYKDFKLLGTQHRTYCTLLKKMVEQDKELEEIEKYYNESIALDSDYPDFEWYLADYWLKQGEVRVAVKYIETCIDKIECYQGMVQSYLMIQINKLYHKAAEIYIETNNTQKALIKIVKLLKVDKYDYKALKMLLSVLDGKEDEERVIQFLENIYDYSLRKDRFTLVQVSKTIENQVYYNYFYNLLTIEEKHLIENLS